MGGMSGTCQSLNLQGYGSRWYIEQAVIPQKIANMRVTM